MFVELLKLHYSVMSRIVEVNEADILVGPAKSVSAKYYDFESHEETHYSCPDDEELADSGGCNSITKR
jgi:hypothetical protein